MSWNYSNNTCRECGEPVTWITTWHGPVPIHDSGSCPARTGSGWYGYGSGQSIRETSAGQKFEFPFVTCASYLQPNARCPLCQQPVWFYQAPETDCILLDHLGPPWATHPCNDNPEVQNIFRNSELRDNFAAKTPVTTTSPPWAREGWMPFIVKQIVQRNLGVEAIGELYDTDTTAPKRFRILQAAQDARLSKRERDLTLGFNLINNPNPVLDAFIESPILLRKQPDLTALDLSAFILRQHAVVLELRVDGELLISAPR